ncbi:uncharacterized protein CMC5_070600 [Chondromyces crocatus]|uniref:Uncharacterized protein n=2 Tax=Chondromyces crocatus TaxID=52 RepID=A0A0K1EQA1_CHOCO|nr:uncharacterized protein CMC5_070600 [Chondromyces crocatus]
MAIPLDRCLPARSWAGYRMRVGMVNAGARWMKGILHMARWVGGVATATVVAAAVGGGCGADADDERCADGLCVCEFGASCNLDCEAPPCNVTCDGNNPDCRGACANGECICGTGSSCDFRCDAPPCHVTCEGDNPDCEGTCANGQCTCAVGSSCDFDCGAPPCHVTCEGDNPDCEGTCANGTCACGPRSSCEFTCESGPCHTTCDEGSTCVVHCANGNAGTQDCDITACAIGDVVVCPGGRATTCGAPCPD